MLFRSPKLSVYDLWAWFETNKKALIIGFAAAVIIGFGIAAYRYSSQQNELAASEALLKLKAPLGASETVAQPEPGAYLKVAEEFSGTSAGARAVLMAGTALFGEGKYQEAQAQFDKFLKDRPQSPFAPTAAYGIAASLEAQKKLDEALAAYQNLSVRYPNSAVLNDAKLGIARIYEAKNQPELALAQYEELSKPGLMSTATAEAMARKKDLLLKNPELAQTNTAFAIGEIGRASCRERVC